MGCSVRTYVDPCMSASQLYVCVSISYCSTDLVPCAACQEYAVCCGERNHPGKGKACCRSHHILLGNTDIYKLLRIFVTDPTGPRGHSHVSVQHDKFIICLC